MIKILKYFLKNNIGQSLTEFVFVFPVLLLIMLVFVQFVVIMDRNEKTQMATWVALRSMTIPEPTWIVVKKTKYDTGTVKNWIVHDFFAKDDIEDIDIDTSVILPIVKSDIVCYTPFIYSGVEFELLQNVFKGIVVMKNNKKCIKLEMKGIMAKFVI